jgi:hypothetical protein
MQLQLSGIFKLVCVNFSYRRTPMKKLISIGAIAIASLAVCGAVQAQTTVNSNFTVTATLVSKCEATNNATGVIAFGTYTAFQTTDIGPIAVSPAITFRCTRAITAPTAAFDAAGGGQNGLIPGANLRYTLSAPVGTKSTTGTAATTAAIGTPDVYSFAFDGTLLANQAGNNAGNNVVSTDTRTLIVTY